MNTWLFTPAFCKAKMLERFLHHVYSQCSNKTLFSHVIIDNHYPINKKQNSAQIKQLAFQYGATYVDSGKDLGLHHGVNNAMKLVGVKRGDTYVGCDYDDLPSARFIDIFSDIMQSDSQLAVACAMFGVIHQRINEQVPFRPKSVAGHVILIHPGIEMWNVGAFNTNLIFDMGGFSQPNAYYGGIEISLFQAWNKKNMYYAYVPEVSSEAGGPVDRNDPTLFDPEYRQWKTDHVCGYQKSFEEWLIERKINATRL